MTITAGLLLGLSRVGAARFAFLMSVPPIILAGSLEFARLLTAEQAVPWGSLLTAVVVSGITGYLCIHYFLRYLGRAGMRPFVIYRLVLAGVIVYVFA